jgi:hypothetical protein
LLSTTSPTAGHEDDETIHVFKITHPFHPLRGKQFVLVTRRQTWGEDRVNYFDDNGKLRSMLTSWTSLADKDYFLQASDGRSWFRVDDLVDLHALLQTIVKNLNTKSEGVK